MPTQGSFVASGHTKVLSLRRSTMEKKLGPLQSVIDQAGVRIAKGVAMKEKDESLVASLQVWNFPCTSYPSATKTATPSLKLYDAQVGECVVPRNSWFTTVQVFRGAVD